MLLIIREMQINADVTSHLSKWVSSINQQATSVGEDLEKRDPFYTLGGNADWYCYCGKQYGVSSKNEKWNSLVP